MEKFNFTVKWMPYPGRYGQFLNNSWTGIMKHIVDEDIDFSACQMTHTPDRVMAASPGFTLYKGTSDQIQTDHFLI